MIGEKDFENMNKSLLPRKVVRAVRKFAREWPRTFNFHLKELREQDADDLADALRALVKQSKK